MGRGVITYSFMLCLVQVEILWPHFDPSIPGFTGLNCFPASTEKGKSLVYKYILLSCFLVLHFTVKITVNA